MLVRTLQGTLCCQIRTARSLLGLVVSYPCGFLIWMDFFIFYPCGFYLGCGFSKVPADAFIRMVFHMLPLWFLGCDSTISYPCGFYSACVFSILPGDVFIRVGFLDLSPSGFYSACVFSEISGDVFILPMCTIQQHRVQRII